jgi:hypothetical protein
MTEKTDINGKDDKGRFTSGNKFGTGRPKGITTHIKELSNDYTDYLDILHSWATDTKLPNKFRFECIKELLDRGAGKPTQYIQSEDSKYIVIGPSDADNRPDELP